MKPNTAWHALDVAKTVDELRTDASRGLDAAEAGTRLAQYGKNALPVEKKETLLGQFLGQFKDFLVLILVAAAAVSLAVGEVTDALVIIAILALNAILGVVQQRRAGQALEALKKLSVPECEVLRSGATVKISSEELVPGDLVILREGSLVPADLRLTESYNLRVDEASLTGESLPVEKTVAPVPAGASLAERHNMGYAGTVVTYGRGLGLVAATGAAREIGRIAQLLEQHEEEATPLQKKLAGFGKFLGIMTLVICALTFVLGVVRGGHLFEVPAGMTVGEHLWAVLRSEYVLQMFLTAVSLAVAAIPEGLPAIVTVVLALGVYRMSLHKAIVRKLPAVETLGCATYICTDKTGTLTENRMVVTRVMPSGTLGGAAADEATTSEEHLFQVAVLCNDSHIETVGHERRRFGDPTELALVEFAEAESVDVTALRARLPRLAEVPFDSSRKRMSTVHTVNGKRRLLVKGAPDVLLPLCTQFETDDHLAPLGPAEQTRAREELDAMAAQALRVLAFAWKEIPPDHAPTADDEQGLVFVGLMGMRDSPRPEAALALAEAAAAGIRTVMITGDNPLTARTIANELGMFDPGDEALTGLELAEISDEELARRMPHLRVFARVWPEQKMRIVQALQADGEIVAMTGDGVNDAPALQKADIGVAMGIAGTDVAKGAADVVLMDDNFATIVKAIEEGRVIFDNIRKFVAYLLACNVGEVLCIFVPVLLGLGVPLLPVQILLINLVTDGLPALALGIDAAEPDIMRRRPRKAREGILTGYSLFVIGFNAVFIAAAVVISFLVGEYYGGEGAGRTMAFVTLACDELLRAFAFRSDHRNLWQIDPRTNLYLVGACGLSALIVLATVLIEPLRNVFGNTPLTAVEWGWALALATIPVAAYEILKVVRRAMVK